MTDPTTLDPAVMAQLLADTGDDADFVRDLIETFTSDAPRLLEEIRASEGDMETQRRAAHSLASNAGTLGAVALAHLARAVEHQARDGVAPSPDALDQVDVALGEAVAALEALDLARGH